MLLISVLRPFDIKQSITEWFISLQPCYILPTRYGLSSIKKKPTRFHSRSKYVCTKTTLLTSYYYNCWKYPPTAMHISHSCNKFHDKFKFCFFWNVMLCWAFGVWCLKRAWWSHLHEPGAKWIIAHCWPSVISRHSRFKSI